MITSPNVLLSKDEIVKAYQEVDLVLDWSRQELFDRCHREAWFAYELGWQDGRPGDPLIFGSLLSQALETMNPNVFDGYKEVGLYPRDNRTAGKGRDLLDLYVRKFGAADSKKYDVVANEYPFGIKTRVADKTVLVKGRLDQLLKDKETGLYWIKEYKHSAAYMKNQDDYFKPYFLGGQTGYYRWAVSQIFGEDSVGGVIIDLFKVTKQATDDMDLVRKIIDDFEIEWDGFDEVVREWFMAREYGFHRSVKSCTRYNSLCPFYPVCKGTTTNEDAMRRAGLTKKEENSWHR